MHHVAVGQRPAGVLAALDWHVYDTGIVANDPDLSGSLRRRAGGDADPALANRNRWGAITRTGFSLLDRSLDLGEILADQRCAAVDHQVKAPLSPSGFS